MLSWLGVRDTRNRGPTLTIIQKEGRCNHPIKPTYHYKLYLIKLNMHDRSKISIYIWGSDIGRRMIYNNIYHRQKKIYDKKIDNNKE